MYSYRDANDSLDGRNVPGTGADPFSEGYFAHCDRYVHPFTAERILRRLEELPVMVQANGDFFLRRATSRMAMRLLQEERIHLLGSDCHGIDRRPPNLAAAAAKIRKKLGEEALLRLEKHQDVFFAMESVCTKGSVCL